MAKKEVYSSARCMASGILIGRLAAGLAAFERALSYWSPGYAAQRAVWPARTASRGLERLLPAARSQAKKLTEILEELTKSDSFSFSREKALEAAGEIRTRIDKIALIAVEACGKRRPAPEEADALLRLKSSPRKPSPVKVLETQAPPQEMIEQLGVSDSSSDIPWAIIAGVALVIGATYWVGRASA